MADALGKITIFFLGAILLFIVPMTIIAVNQDKTKQTYIDDAAVEFVDNARAGGEISVQAYKTLTKRIDSAHSLCDIQIRYLSTYEYPVPVYDATHTITGYTYERHTQEYSKSDITGYMFPNGGSETRSFPLREGGYLSVEVRNVTPTLGGQMLGLFVPGYSGKSLHTSYGGYVGNNKQ